MGRDWELFSNSEFYWLPNKNIARQVARVMLHCAMFKKCVAALRQSLRKVEPDSTSCNTVLQQKCCVTLGLRGMLHLAISLATCVAAKLRDKL